ncbi:histidine--tRNA ligase [Miniphocaeibacter halophilus]|uniref:Histidine--tRNA ligase n=1 Tax=Miniphocaeibacter halophilus TaxID=2931922 RepID=A0AC61N1E9_9FIRM|nr:histidine--tRNA ligase [Miniphocaeibacter halophilus]QQK07718.1 histidine--tRNA ligase [Miniphocaeibacter halophilus]
MSIIQPSVLPGMMELLPEDQVVFNKMKNIIEDTFKKYAFLPIDTPVMEKLEILLAKGGGETTKQVYTLKKGDTDIGLRFDLTVPLARYVAQHFNDLTFPFRRYHIGKVYRGERNQRGRYREFYQCDVDIIGNNSISIYNDAEIPSVMSEIFYKLGLKNFKYLFNNRKVLNGYFEFLGIEDFVFALRTIDKIEKIGVDNVKKELLENNISEETIDKLLDFLYFKGSNEEILEYLKNLNMDNDLFKEGLEELELVYYNMIAYGVNEENIEIKLSITRGLDYYTGSVYETIIPGYESLGSICSGGRYDDLAGNYTKQKLPGVGLSIGLTRLYFQLKEANLLNLDVKMPFDAIILPMKGYEGESIELLTRLRKNDKIVQAYMEGGKLKKQFNYADKLNIPYVIVIGEDEVKNNFYTLRNMKTGEQKTVDFEYLVNNI